ncbi:MAG: hypothetical protein Q8O27_00670, partial [Enterobacteriaceae bacterium]|nr:hypothetical protein [Enterobacteriaceae bacterium]
MTIFQESTLNILRNKKIKIYILIGIEIRIDRLSKLINRLLNKSYKKKFIFLDENFYKKNTNSSLLQKLSIFDKNPLIEIKICEKIQKNYKSLIDYINRELKNNYINILSANNFNDVIKNKILQNNKNNYVIIDHTKIEMSFWIMQEFNFIGYYINTQKIKFLTNVYKKNYIQMAQIVDKLKIILNKTQFIINDLLILSYLNSTFEIYDLVNNALLKNINKTFFIFNYIKNTTQDHILFLRFLNYEIKKILNYKTNIKINTIALYKNISIYKLKRILSKMLFLDILIKSGKKESFWNYIL